MQRAARKHAREPIGERPRIRRPVAVKKPRLVEQELHRIFLEGALAIAKFGERDDEFMPRIHLEDRLRRRGEPPGAGKNAFQSPVGTSLRGDETAPRCR